MPKHKRKGQKFRPVATKDEGQSESQEATSSAAGAQPTVEQQPQQQQQRQQQQKQQQQQQQQQLQHPVHERPPPPVQAATAEPPQQQVRPRGPEGEPQQLQAGMRGLHIDAARELRSAHPGMKLTNKTEDEIQELFQYGKSQKLMKRPGVGKVGKPELLVTNFLEMNVPKFTAYQYRVDMKREGDSGRKPRDVKRRDECWQVFNRFAQANPDVFGDRYRFTCAYDRANTVFTLQELSLGVPTGKVKRLTLKEKIVELDKHQSSSPTYMIELKHVETIDVSTESMKRQYDLQPFDRNRQKLQIIDILIRQHFFNLSTVSPFGRSMYMLQQRLIDLGCGRELLRGWYQSPMITSDWKLKLNVELVASAFYKTDYNNSQVPGIAFAADLLNMQQRMSQNQMPPFLNPHDIKRLDKECKGLEFKTTHLGHRFKCTGVSFKHTANTYKFPDPDDKRAQITIAEYYRRKHGIHLRYKDWPLLQKGHGAGTAFFPFEVCNMADKQRVPNNKLNDKDHTAIIRNTAITPLQRRTDIEKTVADIKYNQHSNWQQIGMSLDMRLKEVNGRVLGAPQLEYKAKQPMNPREGAWNMDQQILFQTPRTQVQHAAVVVIESPQGPGQRGGFRGRGGDRGGYRGRGGRGGHMQAPMQSQNIGPEFYDYLARHARKMELHLPNPSTVVYHVQPCNHDCVLNAVNHVCTKQPQLIDPTKSCLIIFILPFKDNKLYGEVKYRCGQKDIVSQVIQSSNVNRVLQNPGREASLLSNVCLKLNSKLGGINSKLVDNPQQPKIIKQFFEKPIILFGVDVTHDTTGKIPSIAAIASSVDNYPQQYVGRDLVLPPKVEILPHDRLKQAVKNSLIAYFQKTKLKPIQIMYYRDGVSDGQFLEVMMKELCAIQAACRELEDNYRPKITFIVVQKRHHTRLFKKNINPNDRAPRQNVNPGTAVDTDIVHPFEFDFYLCSHQGIQGTSKPTHYHVLMDDYGFSPDQLQLLTYYLCYTYARCTRAVSLPAPVYYAHHIATNARMRQIGSEAADAAGSESVSSFGRDDYREWTEKDLKDLEEKIKLQKRVADDGMYFM